MGAVERLVSAVGEFVDTLDDAQRHQARLPFDRADRRRWAYTAGDRTGVPLWMLSRSQTKTAFRLLAVLVAPAAFAKATAIMALEDVLDQLEGGRSGRRHSRDYWLVLFGLPPAQPWGLRFEGHHVSVSMAVAD